MKTSQLKNTVMNADESLLRLYGDIESQRVRYLGAIEAFERLFGSEREVMLLSVPGRSELLGNHTDHNGGKVLAGAIDRDIIAVVSASDNGKITVASEGYPVDTVELSMIDNPKAFPDFSSAALIAGVAGGLSRAGYSVGGCDVYTTSDVLKGSGISSSAAYEVMIGNIFNHLYNGGKIDNKKIAEISQFAENVYFGKPSGLMDQMACAVGGLVYIDFGDCTAPVIEPASLSLADYGYELCIVNTGGNHADLNDDYASVPKEMKAVAAIFGKERLAGITEDELVFSAGKIRSTAGDRAFMRALHFVRENERVTRGVKALQASDISAFFDEVNASGTSSFKYLQNLYTVKNVAEQGLSLALAITEGIPSGALGACRVHGGGFAGTVQAYIKSQFAAEYAALMSSVFGAGSVMRLAIRGLGATRVF